MNRIALEPRTSYSTTREDLTRRPVDIGGRDIVIGFNEPAPKLGKGEVEIYSELNARFPSYFLPAVDVARSQDRRPMLYLNSGINMAMRWSATGEVQRLTMLAHNKIKFDFLKTFFDRFFPETFSMIEYVTVQDPLRIPEAHLQVLWKVARHKHPKKMLELQEQLIRFKYPQYFATEPTSEQVNQFVEAHQEEIDDAFKYALAHSFAFGDVNFDGNYYLNPKGFASIGGHQEKYFNEIRNLVFDVVDVLEDLNPTQALLLRDNVQIVIEEAENAPPPYNGATRGRNSRRQLDEVTFTNGRPLSYYQSRSRLKPDMDYIYSHIAQDEYEAFWTGYQDRYQDLLARYAEAYGIAL